MTREGAERYIKSEMCKNCSVYLGGGKCSDNCKVIEAIEALEQEPRWIPITSRPMTEEEKEHYKTHPDYQDDCRIFNCKLPDDGQEVLISVYGGAEIDTFIRDADDGCYFEGRDINEVDAWMPLPTPYEPQESEGGVRCE